MKQFLVMMVLSHAMLMACEKEQYKMAKDFQGHRISQKQYEKAMKWSRKHCDPQPVKGK